MSLQAYQLRVAGPLASASKTAIIPVHAYLVTDEAPAAVEASGYFNSAAARLPKGSKVTAIMSFSGTPIMKEYVVLSNDGTTVVVSGETDEESLAATARAVVPTSGGLTTGLLVASDDYVDVTSANADHIITLPAIASVPLGKEIWGKNGGTACEMRTPASSTTKINGGQADSNEAVIAANVSFQVKKTATDNWALLTFTGGAVACPTPD